MKAIIRQVFLMTVLAAFLLLVLVPWSYFFSADMDLSAMLQAPSRNHWLGTDAMGRDLLVRLSQAFFQAVLPLWVDVFLCGILGTGLGFWCLVYAPAGWKNTLVRALRFISMGVVGLPITIMVFLVAAVANEAGLLSLMLPLGMIFFLRSFLQIFDLYKQDEKLGYWQAAVASGMTRQEQIWRYGLMGQWRDVLVQQWFFSLKIAVVIEASLSFLGFGIQEPVPSFGNILSAHFDLYLKGEWYVLLLVVLGFFIVSWFPQAAFQLCKEWLRPYSKEERRS